MIRYFVTHPTAANLMMMLIIILGLFALPNLQRDTFPVIPATDVEIRLAYPGATAYDVEQGICFVAEYALDVVTDLVELRCDSRENLAIITAKMSETGDISSFFDDIKSAIEAINSFPDKVEEPSTTILERTSSVVSIAISSNPNNQVNIQSLHQYAEKVRTRLQQDPRIAQVKLRGFSDLEVLIEVQKSTLNKYNLTMGEISQALSEQSINLPTGQLTQRDVTTLVRFDEQRKTLDEFSSLVLFSSDDGGKILLSDIAKLSLQYEKEEDKIIFNGQRAALLDVIKNYNQDSLRVKDAVMENLLREQALKPKGIQLEISQDVTTNIEDRLRILLENGIGGLILVFLTMWAFFSFRYSFWVTMGLPVSFLGAIFAMNLFGYSINMITMVALLVAIGLLMDDAIIISENIATHIKEGKTAAEAAVDGVKQVLPGVLSSFLTTIMIVGPLFFMMGKMGAVLKYLPAVLVITLAISLIEAFLILPAHLHHSLNHMDKSKTSRFHSWFEKQFNNFREKGFAPLVKASVHKPYITIGFMVFILLASFATIPAGLLKFSAFPNLESDVVQARILLPQGSPLTLTEDVVKQVELGLKQLNSDYAPRQKEGRDIIKNTSVLYNNNIDAYENGTHVATVSGDLIRAEIRHGSVDQMLLDWRQLTGDVDGVINISFTDKERGVAGKAIDIRLQSEDLALLKKASLDLQRYILSFKGVIEVSDDMRPGKPEISIKLKPQANTLGITSKHVSSEIRAALHGNSGLEVQVGKQTQSVVVRLTDNDRNEFNDLQYLNIRNKFGDLVPLSSVATLTQTRGLSRVNRVNGQRTITVKVN